MIVGDLLRESPAPPALRQALYDVAAGIPGVRLTGKVIDALGRTGTGVERDGETLVIDPSDGALLAERDGLQRHLRQPGAGQQRARRDIAATTSATIVAAVMG